MAKKSPSSAAAGYRLAFNLVRDIEAEKNSGVCHIEAQYRPGLPHRNLVAEYLERVRVLKSGDAEEAFTAMLTEFLASAVEDTLPDCPEQFYRQVVREWQRADAAQSDQQFQRFLGAARKEELHG